MSWPERSHSLYCLVNRVVHQEVWSKLQCFSSTVEDEPAPRFVWKVDCHFLLHAELLGHSALTLLKVQKGDHKCQNIFVNGFQKLWNFLPSYIRSANNFVIAKNSLLIFLLSVSAGLAELSLFHRLEMILIVHYALFLWSTYPIPNNFRLMAEGRLDSG